MRCVAPLFWPVPRRVLVGHLPLGDDDVRVTYLPTKELEIVITNRLRDIRELITCPISFDDEQDPRKRRFTLGISWDRHRIAVAGGGHILADSVKTPSGDAICIKLKNDVSADAIGEDVDGTTFGGGAIGDLPPLLTEIGSEIRRAPRCLDILSGEADLVAVVDAWKAFLDAFGKARFKLIASAGGLFSDVQKGKSWVGVFEARISSSTLLSYLLHARNADNHALKAIVAETDGQMTLWSSGVTHIREVLATKEAVEIEFTGTPPHVLVEPRRILASPVIDRGQEYAPPPDHPHLYQLAYGGLVFLEGWLLEAMSILDAREAK